MLHAFDGRTVLLSVSVCPDGGPEGRPCSLHVDVVLDRGRYPEQRREVLFHGPFVFHGPIPLFSPASLLVALARSLQGVLEVVLSDDAVLSADSGCSFGVDGQQLFGSDAAAVELFDE